MFFRLLGSLLAAIALGLCVRGYLQFRGLELQDLRQYYHAVLLSEVITVSGFGGLACQVWSRKKRVESSGWVKLKAWIALERILMLCFIGGAVYFAQRASQAETLVQIKLLRQFLLLSLYLLLTRMAVDLGRNLQAVKGFRQDWSPPIVLRRQKHLELATAVILLSSGLAAQIYLIHQIAGH